MRQQIHLIHPPHREDCHGYEIERRRGINNRELVFFSWQDANEHLLLTEFRCQF